MSEPYAIRDALGHELGTLGGPVMGTVWCRKCDAYVGPILAGEMRTLADGEEVGRCEDNYGDEIVFTHLDGQVCVQFFRPDRDEFVAMWFGSEERDAFIKLWAEAERRAEARELLDRAAVPGQPG